MQANPLLLITGVGEMVVGAAYVLYWRRRHGTPWGFFGWGALAFVVGVAVKAVVALLTTDAVLAFLEQALPQGIADPLGWLYIGSLTGIFESGGALLFIAITQVRRAGWKEAVAYGNGFGSFEAVVLVGLGTIVATLVGILAPESLPPGMLAHLQLPPGSIVLWLAVGPVERVLTVMVHIFAAVLVVYAWRARRWRYLWLSILYKTLFDAGGAFGHLSYGALETLPRIWSMEAFALVFAAIGWWGTKALRPRFEGQPRCDGGGEQ